MNMIPLQFHPHDTSLNHASPMIVRPNDAAHSAIRPGDVLHMQGGGHSILDRQKYQVVGRTEHPNFAHAMNSIRGSSMSARDKINMAQQFSMHHGARVAASPVVTLHVQPHPATMMGQSPTSL